MQLKDQMNRTIRIQYPPKRIVSLVPSQTELLFDLGLEKEVVGITKFCVHPNNWFRNKTRVGGTKNLNLEQIGKLKPDLIIANKEENTESEIKQLIKEYTVWISDIQNLEDAIEMIFLIGKMTNTNAQAKIIINNIQKGFDLLTPKQTKKTAYFIWQNPMMSINKNRFIHDMMSRCGFENIFAITDKDYPEISEDQLQEANPEIILLSSEPYPFRNKHIEQFKEICPMAIIKLVDGEMFSWYGSRLQYATNYFQNLLKSIP
ncbi:MAG: cobalamin-binding protein [Flavobacteriales bacterium]|nr:cobalamin-binding protein [Flavobacteriales bacterium]